MRTLIIIANGELTEDIELEERLLSGCPVIAVDGGAHHCLALGVTPRLIVGDFDSIHSEALAHFSFVEQRRFPADKDETDLELAVQIAVEEFQPERIYVYGALGIRTDHLLANLCITTKFPGFLYLESGRESIWALEKGEEYCIPTRPDQVISLFPIGCRAEGVTTQGLRWELTDDTLDCRFYSVSNRSLGDSFQVTFQRGALVCMLLK